MGNFYRLKAWRTLRQSILVADPLCRQCLSINIANPAVMVDHIIPIRLGGEPLDPDNLQPLCAACHANKTASEKKSGTCKKNPTRG